MSARVQCCNTQFVSHYLQDRGESSVGDGRTKMLADEDVGHVHHAPTTRQTSQKVNLHTPDNTQTWTRETTEVASFLHAERDSQQKPPTLHATGTRDASDPPFQLQTVLQDFASCDINREKKSVRFVLRCLLRRTTRSSHTGHLQADLGGSRHQPTIAKLTVHSHLKTCGSLRRVSLLTRAHYPSKSVWSLMCGYVMFATSYSSNFTPFK